MHINQPDLLPLSPHGRIFNIIIPGTECVLLNTESGPGAEFMYEESSEYNINSAQNSGFSTGPLGTAENPPSSKVYKDSSKYTLDDVSYDEVITPIYTGNEIFSVISTNDDPSSSQLTGYESSDDDHPRSRPSDKASLSEMLKTIWPTNKLFPNTPKMICSINRDFSTSGCSFCKDKSVDFKEKIVESSNWLSGYHNKTPSHIDHTRSTNYYEYLSSLEKVKVLAIPFLPPTTQEEIDLFKANHRNIRMSSDEDDEDDKDDDDFDDLLGPEIKRKSSRFYFNYEGVHLTFPYHFEPESYITFMTQKVKAVISYHSIVQEVGDTGHQHTHVALLFSSKLKHYSTKYFDYKESSSNPNDPKSCHPNMQPITGKATKLGKFQSHLQYFANVVKYHQKQGIPVTNVTEEDLKGMSINESKTTSVKFGRLDMTDMEVNSKKDLIQVCKDKKVDPRDVPKLILAHEIIREHTDKVEIRKVASLYPIQEFILEYTNFDNDRIVIWVADPKGNTGKSYMSTYMTKYHNALTLTTTSLPSVTRALKNHIDKKGNPKTIIIDLARSSSSSLGKDINNTSIYRTIETLKSQYITSTKYDSSVIEQSKPPSVLILSNSFPNVELLTKDRWVIFVIGILPHTIDYTFVGSTGRLSLDKYTEYIDRLKQLNEEGNISSLTNPIKTICDINQYPGSDYLLPEFLCSYWDRGVYPTFHYSMLPPSHTHPKGENKVIITENILSEESFESYKKYREEQTNASYTSIALSEMAEDLNRQIEIKITEKRKLLQSNK